MTIPSTLELTQDEQSFIAAYFEAVYFTETGDLDQPEADAELDSDFQRESILDCLAFYSRIECYLPDDTITQAGHDFWFTRNGHGVGFWDKPEVYGERLADMFTTWAKHYDEAYAIFEV